MLLTIIILIFALSALAVGVNAIQQHKQRVELERRQQMFRYRGILDETENLITLASDFPVGKGLLHVLRVRARDALRLLIDVQPKTKELQIRLEEYEEAVKNHNPEDKSTLITNFTIPQQDKQIVAMIHGLKKLRKALRAEYGRNRVDATVFQEEEKRISKTLLQISVETLIRRGEGAFSSGMLGSARQYFEKAQKSLQDATFDDPYISEKLGVVTGKLEDIANSLRDVNASDARKRDKKSDLDELFQPKKKW
ncbi:hypothetical protein [Aliidiomarina celeris]|uniref:hypothetical protein n=1 Tax=Aliidiomarina celeris TaxID=2249428 RepID=UPI000DEAF2D2|nr:hypothetical protein [Aliidiomarina celeris]